jgi:hypothetical protein
MTIDEAIHPVTVHIVQDDTKGEKRPEELRTAHRTIVLTATTPYAQVVGYDPARAWIKINVFDNNIVLSGDISQASDLANQTSTLAAPNGRLLGGTGASVEYEIYGNDEQWITTGTYPTRVGITITRKI